MSTTGVFALEIAGSFLTFGLVAWWWAWPRLKAMRFADALSLAWRALLCRRSRWATGDHRFWSHHRVLCRDFQHRHAADTSAPRLRRRSHRPRRSRWPCRRCEVVLAASHPGGATRLRTPRFQHCRDVVVLDRSRQAGLEKLGIRSANRPRRESIGYLISGTAKAHFQVFPTLWATRSPSYLGVRLRSQNIHRRTKEHERQLQVLRSENGRAPGLP